MAGELDHIWFLAFVKPWPYVMSLRQSGNSWVIVPYAAKLRMLSSVSLSPPLFLIIFILFTLVISPSVS